jgi:hypothetical protein
MLEKIVLPDLEITANQFDAAKISFWTEIYCVAVVF